MRTSIVVVCGIATLMGHPTPDAAAGADPSLAYFLPLAPARAPTNTRLWLFRSADWIAESLNGFGLEELWLTSNPYEGEPWDSPDARALGGGTIEIASTLGDVEGCTFSTGITELRTTEPLAPSSSYGYGGFTQGLIEFDRTFWTDEGEDRVVPVFAGIGDVVVEQIRCAFEDRVEDRIRVSASGEGEATDDHLVVAYRLYADDAVIAASSDSTVRAIVPALTEERCFSMRAVDVAGNVDENEAVACLGPDDLVQGPSYELRPWSRRWHEVLPDDAPADASGCRAAPGRSSGSAWWGWLVLVLILGVGARSARR